MPPPEDGADSSSRSHRGLKFKTPKSQDAPDPRHHGITSAWFAQYAAAMGGDYALNGRDVSTLKRFLRGNDRVTVEDFLNTAQKAWARAKIDRFVRFCKGAGSIAGMCNAWSEIRFELQSPTFDNQHQRRDGGGARKVEGGVW